VQLKGLEAEAILFEGRFDTLRKLLTEKYGTPFYRNDDKKPSATFGNMGQQKEKLETSGTIIDLNYVDTGRR